MSKVIDYADLPRSEWPPIINRVKAKDVGLKRFFTGKPCKHGHVAERGANTSCLICAKIYRARPENKARTKIYKQGDKYKDYLQSDKYKARVADFRASDKCKEAKKKWASSANGKACAKKNYDRRKQTDEYKAYTQSDAFKARVKASREKPDNAERRKVYAKEYGKSYVLSDEQKEAKKEYNRGCKMKAYRKKYYSTVDAKRKAKARRDNPEHKDRARKYSRDFHISEKGTASCLKGKFGFSPPEYYVKAIHQQRILKRELRKLKTK